jgi:importin-7
MLPSLDNFVSFGTDAFKSRADYRQMVLDIYTTCMTSDQLGENDRVNGCKLAESILLNLRGHVDDVRVMIFACFFILHEILSAITIDHHYCSRTSDEG